MPAAPESLPGSAPNATHEQPVCPHRAHSAHPQHRSPPAGDTQPIGPGPGGGIRAGRCLASGRGRPAGRRFRFGCGFRPGRCLAFGGGHPAGRARVRRRGSVSADAASSGGPSRLVPELAAGLRPGRCLASGESPSRLARVWWWGSVRADARPPAGTPSRLVAWPPAGIPGRLVLGPVVGSGSADARPPTGHPTRRPRARRRGSVSADMASGLRRGYPASSSSPRGPRPLPSRTLRNPPRPTSCPPPPSRPPGACCA